MPGVLANNESRWPLKMSKMPIGQAKDEESANLFFETRIHWHLFGIYLNASKSR